MGALFCANNQDHSGIYWCYSHAFLVMPTGSALTPCRNAGMDFVKLTGKKLVFNIAFAMKDERTSLGKHHSQQVCNSR